jgi:Carbohydrate esterase, sialic acid-specific acetylesterase
MLKVHAAIEGKKIRTVTLVWMQGEHDAGEKNDDVYKESLLGLIKQLGDDLKRDDVNQVHSIEQEITGNKSRRWRRR